MEERIYVTEGKVHAPFLLDQEQLKNLDNIIKKEWGNLLNYKNKEIIRASEEEFQNRINRGWYKEKGENEQKAELEKIRKAQSESYRFGREEKKLTLHFKDGDSLRVGSFSEAFRNIDVKEKRVVGFEVEIYCGQVTCNLEVDREFKQMKTTVRPSDLQVSGELFLGLRRWMDNIKAPLWERLVKWGGGIHWAVLGVFFTIGFAFLETGTTGWKEMERAHELLKDGISKEEHDAAMETVLAIVSEFDKPKPALRNIPNWYKCSFVGFTLACIAISFIPTVVIGIGKGEKTIILWRRWLRFISVTVPIIFFSSFIWPYIVNLVTSFFPR